MVEGTETRLNFPVGVDSMETCFNPVAWRHDHRFVDSVGAEREGSSRWETSFIVGINYDTIQMLGSNPASNPEAGRVWGGYRRLVVSGEGMA